MLHIGTQTCLASEEQLLICLKGGMERVSPVQLVPSIEHSRHGCAAAKDIG